MGIMPTWRDKRNSDRIIRHTLISPHISFEAIMLMEALKDMTKQGMKQTKHAGSQLKNGNHTTQTCTLTRITPNLLMQMISCTRNTTEQWPSKVTKGSTVTTTMPHQRHRPSTRTITEIIRNHRSWWRSDRLPSQE